MLSGIFTCLVYTSFTGSVLAGAIILTKLILKHRLGAAWNCGIWMLLLIRLCMPYVPESPFSVFNVINFINRNFLLKVGGHTYKDGNGIAYSDSGLLGFQIDSLPQDYFLPVSRSSHFGVLDVLLIIWLFVAIALVMYVVIYNLRVGKLIKAEKQWENTDVMELFETCLEKMKIKSEIKVLKTGKKKSPALYGLIRSVLLLPEGIETKLDNASLTHIMIHELAHYKRKDILLYSIISCFQILHWFNPILWYSFNWMRQDIEIACDATALKYLEDSDRRNYATTIISSMECFANNALLAPMASVSGGNAQIKNRIKMIMSFRRETISGFIWKAGIVFMVGCVALTNGMTDTDAYGQAKNALSEVIYEDLNPYMQGYDGSFVLFDLEKETYYIFNEKKAKERVSPYSTFKLVDALVALQTGVLKDANTVRKWNGTWYPFEQWNQDQTLASAMQYSVNWYFEEACQQIGRESMQKYISILDYGNQDLSGGIRDFWNQSSLKISPEEQVEILRKIYTYETIFSKSNVDIVKKMIKLTEKNSSTLYGKTGTGLLESEEGIGWFIGFVEKKENTYIFAANIQGDKQVDGALAREITLSILKDKKIYQ